MISPSIHEYIKQQETAFEADEIQVGENWSWNFRRHVQLIFHLKHGIFFQGSNDYLRAFKNIMAPVLQLAYWTEDLEVKDVVFFIENRSGRVLSFLLKKYHDEIYVKAHDLDTLFDQLTESDLDYGGIAIQKGKNRPEIIPLNAIVFADQTNLLGGPLGIKYYFSPEQLRSMSKLGWGKTENGATISLEDLCLLAGQEKAAPGALSDRTNRVPGKVVEVYIVRGNLPEHYLLDNDNLETYYNQIQIVAFYQNKDNERQQAILYRKKEDEGQLKFHSSSPIFGRALGLGEGEALIHPQIWTNCLTIWKQQMLEAGSKVPLVTDDPSYHTKNKIQEMENLEITTIADGKRIYPVPTLAGLNIQLFERSIDEWYQQAQLSGAAFDPIMGKEPPSGTTFRGQERSVAQGRGFHDRRRGQRAKFIEQLYRDWIIPDMVKEITQGKTFLATLTAEEMTWVSDQLAENYVNKRLKEMILEGKMPTREEQDLLKQTFKELFVKEGNRRLIEIIGQEFDDIEIKVGINIAGKQKNLANLSDKVLSIFQLVFNDPQRFRQAMQIPALARAFEDILEFSGLSQVDFTSLLAAEEIRPVTPTPPVTPPPALAVGQAT